MARAWSPRGWWAHPIETVGGLAVLGWLVLRTRGMRCEYWRWRRTTAMGDAPGRVPLGRGVLAHARWMWRMRRLG